MTLQLLNCWISIGEITTLTLPIQNGDGEAYGYPVRPNTAIKTSQMPINYYLLISYSRDSVKAGYKIKGYIRADGNPDSVSLRAYYPKGGINSSSSISTTFAGGNQYHFEWIIPQTVDDNTFIIFSVSISKGGSTFGNDRWIDTWPVGNSSHAVLYIKGMP
jgi:hypothetical protein